MQHDEVPKDTRYDEPEHGGDPVCWMNRVCPECGLFAEQLPPTICARCGNAISVQ